MAKPTIQTGVRTPPTSQQLRAQARASSPVDAEAFSEQLAKAEAREADGITPLPEPVLNDPINAVAQPTESTSFTDRLTQAAQGFGLVRAPHFRTAFEVNNRDAQVMTWRLPNGSAVQMYINPQNFVVRDSKQITETRTKGGFVIQYWGENLTQLTLSGTTGSSGIRGIQVLRDIYRSEGKGFDLIAAQIAGDVERLKSSIALKNGPELNTALEDVALDIQKRNFLLRPSLASLAVNVLLFYQGVQYKGFFKDFTMTESTSKLGLFDYTLSFVSTETRGKRLNFMPWHKEPIADDPAGQLINGVGNAVRGAFGLAPQPPESFHPATAPYTFGGNSLAAGLGFSNEPLTEERTIFL